MPNITIGGSVIQFPNSGGSPNWAPAVVEFAEAVETALQSATGTYDVAPQVLPIDDYNGSGADITALSFSTAVVRSFEVHYSVYRKTSTDSASESGVLYGVYNSDTAAWSMSRDAQGKLVDASADEYITFALSSGGQISFDTSTMAGTGYTASISFYAKTNTQS
jgi:hypothetical protein